MNHIAQPAPAQVANPVGLKGLAFLVWASPDPSTLETLFGHMGFSRTHARPGRAVDVWTTGEARFVLDRQSNGHSAAFARTHSGCVPGMGLLCEDRHAAFAEAIRRGAKAYMGPRTLPVPTLQGLGGSLIYLVDDTIMAEFVAHTEPVHHPSRGFTAIDHLTNNVHKGTLQEWSRFYQDVFGFTEVRHFDIKGEQTGLLSYALRSPDGSFCIPINEGNDDKSQIEEYLRDYPGPGVQHIALLSDDLLGSLDAMDGALPTLDIDDDYYAAVFDRVPHVAEAPDRIQQHQVLVDGDDDGYLLQIFTKNMVGPIFFEFIQRRDHLSFGEGNFGALFRSIERDQQRRGVL